MAFGKRNQSEDRRRPHERSNIINMRYGATSPLLEGSEHQRAFKDIKEHAKSFIRYGPKND